MVEERVETRMVRSLVSSRWLRITVVLIAAAQIAVVTQNCNSTSSGGGPLKVEITSADGSPLSNQIVGNSVCLNYSQIFQIVQQLCIGCQLVVQNFYSSTTNVNTTNQTI